jgi:hypothetical protein
MDGDALLAEGRTPVSEAASAMAELEAGQVLLIEVSFQPAPLVDAFRAKGHELHCEEDGAGRWRVWLRRR